MESPESPPGTNADGSASDVTVPQTDVSHDTPRHHTGPGDFQDESGAHCSTSNEEHISSPDSTRRDSSSSTDSRSSSLLCISNESSCAASRSASPTTDVTPITLTGIEAKLLQKEDVQREIKERRLSVSIESHKDKSMAIMISGDGSAAAVLKSDIRTETLKVHKNSTRIQKILQVLNRKDFRSKLVIELRGDTLSLAFLSSLKERVTQALKQFDEARKIVPLSGQKLRYVERHEEYFVGLLSGEANCSSEKECTVQLEIASDCGDKTYMTAKCEWIHSQKVFSTLDKRLASITSKEVETRIGLGLFLHSVEGRRDLHDLVEEYHCFISIEIPFQRLLFAASHLMREHHLTVCQGNMAALGRRHVIVVPRRHGQTDWPPVIKYMLKREALSSKPARYADKVGPSPLPRTFGRTIHSGPIEIGHVIIMDVPVHDEENYTEKLFSAFKTVTETAVTSAAKLEKDVVLWLDLCEELPLLGQLETVLRAVLETLDARDDIGRYVTLCLNHRSFHVSHLLSCITSIVPYTWSTDFLGTKTETSKEKRPSQTDHSEDKACITVIGLTHDVEMAIDKMTNITIPNNFGEQEEEFFKLRSPHTGEFGFGAEGSKGEEFLDVCCDTCCTHVETNTFPISSEKAEVLKTFLAAEGEKDKKHRFLFGEESEVFSVKITHNDFLEIKCRRACYFAPELMQKITRLTQEDVLAPNADDLELASLVDTCTEGREAFVIPMLSREAFVIPMLSRNKVAIFGFDFKSISDVKHKVNVKLGNVKMTGRAKPKEPAMKSDAGNAETA